MPQLTKRIIYRRNSDGAILFSSPNGLPEAGETEVEFLNRKAARALAADPQLADCVVVGFIEGDQMPLKPDPQGGPPNKLFRDCWTWENGGVKVSLPKARQQRLAEIRSKRDDRLTESDKDIARLNDIGTPEQIAAMKAHRQRLRDLPATVQTDLAAITTADGLDQYQPAWPVKP